MTLIVKSQDTERGHHLGGRPDVDQGIPLPGPRRRDIPMSAPEIHDSFIALDDTNGSAKIPFHKILFEPGANRLPGRIAQQPPALLALHAPVINAVKGIDEVVVEERLAPCLERALALIGLARRIKARKLRPPLPCAA